MDVVGSSELGEEGWDYVREQDDAFGYGGTDKIESSGKDDDVENIIYEAYV